jgi:hypothetical protein
MVSGGPPQRGDHCLGLWRRNDQHDRQRRSPKRFRPLTWGFGAPLAGLEPATYGLEVRQSLSVWCRLGASPQVASGPPSAWWHPGRLRPIDRIASLAMPAASAELVLPVADKAPGRCAGRRSSRSQVSVRSARSWSGRGQRRRRYDPAQWPVRVLDRGLRCAVPRLATPRASSVARSWAVAWDGPGAAQASSVLLGGGTAGGQAISPIGAGSVGGGLGPRTLLKMLGRVKPVVALVAAYAADWQDAWRPCWRLGRGSGLGAATAGLRPAPRRHRGGQGQAPAAGAG